MSERLAAGSGRLAAGGWRLAAGGVLGASVAIAGCVRDAAAVRQAEAPAHVVAIHPGSGPVPENLLRAYVEFSAPMRLGESASRLALLDDTGRPVAGAFIPLEEELWDPSRRRLTVLFDPGRIKRGLRTNLEQGPPLVAGRRYRLVVDARWRDGRGRPLAGGHAADFEVGPADREAPDPSRWEVRAPEPGTRAPLVVRFPEPLDRALLSHALTVIDPLQHAVTGGIDVVDGDREWRFVPDRPWVAGPHALAISTLLEDVAGNSLRRVFDADLTEGVRPGSEADHVTLPVRIGGRPTTE